MANPQQNWLLIAYLNPNATLGTIADRITAAATLATLRERAFAFACRSKVFDPDLADEALCSMLAWVGESDISSKFSRERGTPRQFINKILRNHVTLEIRKKYRRVVGTLPDNILASKELDPAKDAEIRELTAVCQKLVAEDEHCPEDDEHCPEDDENAAGGAAVTLKPDEPPSPSSAKIALTSTVYVQRHRERKRRWVILKHHFPEIEEMRQPVGSGRREQKFSLETRNRPHGASRRSSSASSVPVTVD